MDRSTVMAMALATLLLAAVAGCMSPGAAPSGRLDGEAVAGPTCPVVTDPPQSGCEARPVDGARLVIVDATGTRVATVTTGNDGRFGLDLAPGIYEVQPQPVEGLMGTAPPATVTITTGQPAHVTVSYDTGIR
jgi:hypothetical protein